MFKLKSNKNLELKKSRNGLGVFTKKEYKVGDTILEIKGPFIACDVNDNIDEDVRSNAFRYDSNLFIDASGDFPFYLNHSCVPNSKIVKKLKKLYLVAIKNIIKGEELFFDYSTVIARDDIWTMDCNCGESLCRGRVQRFNKLPKSKKEFYIKNKIVPNFILNI